MDLVKKICEELGIEIGKTWVGNNGYEYKITEDGLLGFYYMTSDGWVFDTDPILWSCLVRGELKPTWKPTEGQRYHTPALDDNIKFTSYRWTGSETDKLLFERGLVFKTSEEAIEATNKMLEALGGDK